MWLTWTSNRTLASTRSAPGNPFMLQVLRRPWMSGASKPWMNSFMVSAGISGGARPLSTDGVVVGAELEGAGMGGALKRPKLNVHMNRSAAL